MLNYYTPLADEQNSVLDNETQSQTIQLWQLAAALQQQQTNLKR